jgi:hypothetical protein
MLFIIEPDLNARVHSLLEISLSPGLYGDQQKKVADNMPHGMKLATVHANAINKSMACTRDYTHP